MSQDDPTQFLTRLKQFEGRELGEPFVARDAVNVAMIRHWCDAMSDANPVYTDPEAAERSLSKRGPSGILVA